MMAILPLQVHHPGPALLNDHSSDAGEDNLGRDRADDASDGDICATNVDDACESDMQDSAVPAKYHFKTSHLQRLFRQYDWYSYDESTCMSWCLACAWSPSSCGKCKLKDGVLIDSDHISSRLKKHGGESNHIKAYNNWDPRVFLVKQIPTPNWRWVPTGNELNGIQDRNFKRLNILDPVQNIKIIINFD